MAEAPARDRTSILLLVRRPGPRGWPPARFRASRGRDTSADRSFPDATVRMPSRAPPAPRRSRPGPRRSA